MKLLKVLPLFLLIFLIPALNSYSQGNWKYDAAAFYGNGILKTAGQVTVGDDTSNVYFNNDASAGLNIGGYWPQISLISKPFPSSGETDINFFGTRTNYTLEHDDGYDFKIRFYNGNFDRSLGYVNNGSNFKDLLTFTNEGNVVVGEEETNTNFSVNGDISFTGNLYKNGQLLSVTGSQWTTSGANIYFNGGNIGIGTISPSYKLDVKGNGIQMINPAANGYMFIGRNTDPGNDSYFYTRTYTNFNLIGSNKNGTGTLKGLGFTIGGGDTENDIKMSITSLGNVLIGKTSQTNTNYKLDIAGKVRANEVTVNTTGADFVFEKNYKLRPLGEVESFIKANKHLPDVAPATAMQTDGVSVGEMQAKLLEKVEELTLYVIEQGKQLTEQRAVINDLKVTMEELKKKVNSK